MFQNISEEINKEESKRFKVDVKELFLELLKLQNVIIYLLTFFISTLSIKQEIIPFGIAMVAACLSSSIPIIGVYIFALVGTYVGNGFSATINFVMTSIIYLVFVLFFKSKVAVDERNEVIRTGKKLFLACLIVEFINNLKGIFLMYDLFMGIISSALIYVFYKIFVNGISVIKNFKIKEAFSIEELIAASIIISIASLYLNKLNVFSLNISNIVIIFIIMLLGWKNGMMIGATAGIAIGLIVSFTGNYTFLQILMFAVSGICSGILNKFGKIGVIVGFVLGNAVLTYITNGNTIVISYFREIFVASIGLIFVPNNVKLTAEDLIGKNKLLSNVGETRLNGTNVKIAESLKSISNIIYDLMNTQEMKVDKIQDDFIQEFLDNLEEIDTNMFYEEISKEENEIALDIYKCIEKNEIIVDKDLVEILMNHNNYVFMQDENIKNDLQEIIKIANRSYKIIQINIAKEQEKNRNVKLIKENLKEVTKVIDECAEKIVDNSEKELSNKEKEIEILLKSKKIEIENCSIKKLKNKKNIIKIKINNKNLRPREKDVTLNIADLISKNLGTKITFQREKNSDENSYTQVYANDDKYIMQVGSSKIAKEGNEVSGDCNLQMRLDDGKYLLAIADGMGSGEKARESSKFVIKMMKKLFSAGFDDNSLLTLINTSLEINSNSETYSSIDLSIFDLYTGQAELIKNAACNTYIKNKKNIKVVNTDNLPVGIIENVNLKSQILPVVDGDIVVMCSDGVLESKEELKNDWIEDFLKNISTNNVQKLSDLILAEAIDNNYGIAKDDMTVIVCKIIKKK